MGDLVPPRAPSRTLWFTRVRPDDRAAHDWAVGLLDTCRSEGEDRHQPHVRGVLVVGGRRSSAARKSRGVGRSSGSCQSAVTDFIAYHDRTSQDHQNQFNTLYPQGYRIISLSVYQPADPRYAAVWVRRPGSDWSAVHGVNAAGYQAAFDNAAAAGFHPTIIAAAGPASSAVFAGVFEKRPGPVPAHATHAEEREQHGPVHDRELEPGRPREGLDHDLRRGVRRRGQSSLRRHLARGTCGAWRGARMGSSTGTLSTNAASTHRSRAGRGRRT